MQRQYKLARKTKKMTLTAAAQELGVSQPTLSAWENERKNPSVESLIRMADFYGVTTDFLLGRTQQMDSFSNHLQPIPREALPAHHGTPVYADGWAFVDAVEHELRFADGSVMPFADAQRIYIIPPAFVFAAPACEKPLNKSDLSSQEEVWVEPISRDEILRTELRGWYRVKGKLVENEVGQCFYLDFYGAKWLAFAGEWMG